MSMGSLAVQIHLSQLDCWRGIQEVQEGKQHLNADKADCPWLQLKTKEKQTTNCN